MSAFRDILQRRQMQVEQFLLQTFAEAIEGTPLNLVEAMRYSLMAPGKRLRPILVLMACEAVGGTDEAAIPAACAVEMVHTYSLIHDDLPAMDDDDLRRGFPTCHKKYGEALAILAGDGLLTLAFQVLAQRYAPATAAVSCLELAMGSGSNGMVGGQVLDLIADGRIQGPTLTTVQDLETIHCRKTGALFRTCLRLGFYAAQGQKSESIDPAILVQLDHYSQAFGLAFQIVDDLLDVEGHSDRTGKRVGKDADRGKLTYPGLLGIAESRRLAESLVNEATQALNGLGRPAEPLKMLARYVMDRDK